MPHDIAVIRELVTAAFSDEELRTLCFDHFPAIYEQFAAGQTKGQRVLALVDYADRHLLLDDLLARVKAANPRKYAEFAPQLGAAAGGTAAALGKPRISLARLPATGPDLFGREQELAALDRAAGGGCAGRGPRGPRDGRIRAVVRAGAGAGDPAPDGAVRPAGRRPRAGRAARRAPHPWPDRCAVPQRAARGTRQETSSRTGSVGDRPKREVIV